MPVSHAQGLSTVSVFVLQSNNMFPTLRKDDTVVVDSNVSFNSLKVGDIIAFKTYGTNDSGQHETVASRVHEIRSDPNNSQRVIRTKGDANPASIPYVDYPIFRPLYIGKVVRFVNKGNISTSQNIP